jgi:hypothetical protein
VTPLRKELMGKNRGCGSSRNLVLGSLNIR